MTQRHKNVAGGVIGAPKWEIAMKAAVLRKFGRPLTIEDVSISKPPPREVLIRTVAAGICHTDLHYAEGHYKQPLADRSRSRIRRHYGSGRKRGAHGAQGRSRDHLSLRFLRPLQSLPDRGPIALRQSGSAAAAGQRVPSRLSPISQHVVLKTSITIAGARLMAWRQTALEHRIERERLNEL